jgi:hypothetical protein
MVILVCRISWHAGIAYVALAGMDLVISMQISLLINFCGFAILNLQARKIG